MYQPDAELLFPARVIPALEGLRGERWDELVNSVCSQPEGSLDGLSFSLMMIRLDGFLRVIDELVGDYRIITMDQRGHGFSGHTTGAYDRFDHARDIRFVMENVSKMPRAKT